MARSQHRFERTQGELRRKTGTRAAFQRALIACEGSKTERNYFEDIRRQLRLPKSQVTVLPPDRGTEPRQVVDYAVEKFLESNEYDVVYAVFDRDKHNTYDDALARAAQLNASMRNDFGRKVPFFAVPSVPNFELWLLIHFVDNLSFVDRFEVINKLGQHIPGYSKGMNGIYSRTEACIPDATTRAERLRELFAPEGGNDPYTVVDQVVAKLRSFGR